jgi:glycosyltransferase involved in cell wall biosynthesis
MIFQGLLQIVLMIWAIGRFDAFVFNGGVTFLPRLLDLPILRWFGKRIIHYFAGSDSFPAYLNLPDTSLRPRGEPVSIKSLVRQVRRQKRDIRWIERYADVSTDYPLFALLHEKPFVNDCHLGLPVSEQEPAVPGPDERIRVLHCPSNPVYKGTSRIRRAVQSLISKGVPLRYTEITGRPNSEVLAELRRCDFVIDQVYFDAPMAVFSAEAASFGRPAVVGGYARSEFQAVFPPQRMPPVLYCHPDQLEDAIEKMAVDRELRQSLGAAALEFVRRWWSPARFSQNYLKVITGNIPEEWWFDPKGLRYVPISGVSDDTCREVLRSLVEQEGRESLLLSDKPELERILLGFVQGGRNAGMTSRHAHASITTDLEDPR